MTGGLTTNQDLSQRQRLGRGCKKKDSWSRRCDLSMRPSDLFLISPSVETPSARSYIAW